MSAITVGGDLVHYEVLGRGRPVVLVHGWLGSWRYWIPVMRQLQLKYRVYAVDLFGFGDSSKNVEKYSLNHQVHLMDEFMRQLGISKSVMIGHGLGAWVLSRYAQQEPDRVHRMMVVTAPLFDPGDLMNRRRPNERTLLTPNNNTSPFPKPADIAAQEEAYKKSLESPSSTAAPAATPAASPAPGSHSDATLSRRPAGLDFQIGKSSADPTVSNSSNDTITSPSQINRAKLQEAALARGAAILRGDEPQISGSANYESANNPLKDALAGTLDALLSRCFKRNEPEYERLQADLGKVDPAVIKRIVANFDAGTMLDTLYSLKMPILIVHGEDDPIMKAPTESVWNYLTLGKEDTVPVPMRGVRHFPMLESEAFMRLTGTFLEAPDVSKIEIQERWRRRTR